MIILAKRGVLAYVGIIAYMGACYTWNFTWVVDIVIGNTGRTGKNSGGLVKFFTQQSCGPVAFSTKVFSTSIQCVINIHE